MATIRDDIYTFAAKHTEGLRVQATYDSWPRTIEMALGYALAPILVPIGAVISKLARRPVAFFVRDDDAFHLVQLVGNKQQIR